MRGIICIGEGRGGYSGKTSYWVWVLWDGKAHADYGYATWGFKDVETGEAYIKDVLIRDDGCSDLILVSEEQFRAEVRRRSDVIRTQLVYVAP